MAARPFRCPKCARSLGQTEHILNRRGRREMTFKPEPGVKIEWRFMAGRWATCVCGEVTRIPKAARVTSAPEEE